MEGSVQLNSVLPVCSDPGGPTIGCHCSRRLPPPAWPGPPPAPPPTPRQSSTSTACPTRAPPRRTPTSCCAPSTPNSAPARPVPHRSVLKKKSSCPSLKLHTTHTISWLPSGLHIIIHSVDFASIQTYARKMNDLPIHCSLDFLILFPPLLHLLLLLLLLLPLLPSSLPIFHCFIVQDVRLK